LPNTKPEEAFSVLRKWGEEHTRLRVTVELESVYLDSEATISGVDPIRFALALPGENNFFELDFGTCAFAFGLDPDAPDDRTALVCIRLDGKVVFVANESGSLDKNL
jgi:hypothetical protein